MSRGLCCSHREADVAEAARGLIVSVGMAKGVVVFAAPVPRELDRAWLLKHEPGARLRRRPQEGVPSVKYLKSSKLGTTKE